MITTTLKSYWYPQKGLITMVTELGEFTKFKGFVEKTKEGIIFHTEGQTILAKH